MNKFTVYTAGELARGWEREMIMHTFNFLSELREESRSLAHICGGSAASEGEIRDWRSAIEESLSAQRWRWKRGGSRVYVNPRVNFIYLFLRDFGSCAGNFKTAIGFGNRNRGSQTTPLPYELWFLENSWNRKINIKGNWKIKCFPCLSCPRQSSHSFLGLSPASPRRLRSILWRSCPATELPASWFWWIPCPTIFPRCSVLLSLLSAIPLVSCFLGPLIRSFFSQPCTSFWRRQP